LARIYNYNYGGSAKRESPEKQNQGIVTSEM